MNKDKQNIETFLASQTALSRREIFKHLQNKNISVNGHVIHSITHQINYKIDVVVVDGKRIYFKHRFMYYKFNKPRHVISTLDDPKGRKTVKDYMKKLPDSLFPIGRLDRQTKGLLLFTNDGQFSHALMHPSFKLPKTYIVTLDKPIEHTHLKRLSRSFFLDDGPVKFISIEKLSSLELKVDISEGRNRIIRRCFEFFGYTVTKLVRLSIGPIQLGPLKEGCFKPLSKKEFYAIQGLIEKNTSNET